MKPAACSPRRSAEGGIDAEGVDARQVAAEERIRRTVTDIVEGVVGQGNARVQVTAEMDFNRVSETSERFDPEGRVVRSTSTHGRNVVGWLGGGGATTAGANVPDTTAGGASGGGGAASNSSSQETGQLRNLAHDAHRSERRRPHSPAVGGGRGRWRD